MTARSRGASRTEAKEASAGRFRDRVEAGRALAAVLEQRGELGDVVVFGLPPRGRIVAEEVAWTLGTRPHVFPVRPLRMADVPELIMGAVAIGATVLDSDVVDELRVPPDEVREQVAAEQRRLIAWARQLSEERDNPVVRDRLVILVDEGIGMSPAMMRAALISIRKLEPKRVIVAVPVAAPHALLALQDEADEIVTLRTPRPFRAVDYWYEDFGHDDEDEMSEVGTGSMT